jgi:hypothetical protein
MTSLSPAAQAVLAAAGDSEPGIYATIAAALRAAAKELGPSRKLEPGYIFSAPAEHWHYEFKLEAERRLLAIAAELEGQ